MQCISPLSAPAYHSSPSQLHTHTHITTHPTTQYCLDTCHTYSRTSTHTACYHGHKGTCTTRSPFSLLYYDICTTLSLFSFDALRIFRLPLLLCTHRYLHASVTVTVTLAVADVAAVAWIMAVPREDRSARRSCPHIGAMGHVAAAARGREVVVLLLPLSPAPLKGQGGRLWLRPAVREGSAAVIAVRFGAGRRCPRPWPRPRPRPRPRWIRCGSWSNARYPRCRSVQVRPVRTRRG